MSVLLLEFVNADQFPGRVSELMPFIRGYLDANGVEARWLRFSVATTNLLEFGRDEITLSAPELEVLLGAAADLSPTVVVATDPLFRPQQEALSARSHGARFVLAGAFAGLPGLPPYRYVEHLDEPGFWPRYDWEAGNARAREKKHDNVYLCLRERCGHPLPLARNPRYAGLEEPGARAHRGCAFCGNMALTEQGCAPTPEGWVARQIEAIARSRRVPEAFPNAILLTVLPRPALLERCIEGLREARMLGHVALLLAARTDQARWVASTLRAALSSHAGLRAGVYASGLESFDAQDLELYNKGTRPLDGLQAIAAWRALAEEFPGRFSWTGLTFLLLTPWTTLEGLHLNFGLLRLLELDGREAGNVFQSQLRMHEGLPIAALAQREGLVTDDEPDPVLRLNRRKLFARERPWRFRDGRLRPLSQILMRYELVGSRLADPLTHAVGEHLRRAEAEGPRGGDLPLFDFTSDQIEELLDSPRVPEPQALLAGALRRAQDRQTRSSDSPCRAGEEVLGPGPLLARLRPHLHSGLVPIACVPGVPREAAPVIAGLHTEWIAPWDDRPGPGELLVSADAGRLAERVLLEREIRQHAGQAEAAGPAYAAGLLHGHPECCARAWSESGFAGLGLRAWAALLKRGEGAEALAALSPQRVPALGFVPCTPDCRRAAARCAELLGARGAPAPDPDEAEIFGLDPSAWGEWARLRVTGFDAAGFWFAPGTAVGTPALLARLRRAERAVLVPGQVRLLGQGTLVGLLTASHGLWFARRAWHAAEWAELVRARRWVELRRRSSPRPAPPREGARSRLVVGVTDSSAGGARYRFCVARHASGSPFYRRVGPLILWYEHADLTPRAARFAEAVLAAMTALQRQALAAGSIALWRDALQDALARAACVGYDWDVEWSVD